MAYNSSVQVRIDDNLKKEADKLFNDLGLDMSSAIRLFLKQAVLHNSIPFRISMHIPNAETIAAIEDVNNNCNMSHTFDNAEDLTRDLNA